MPAAAAGMRFRLETGVIWRLGAMAAALLVALPLFGVLGSVFIWQGEVWRHVAQTQLSAILLNSAILLLGVGIGSVTIGAGSAWLVTLHRFPGSRILEWALLLPLVMPTYIIGYAYADLLAFAGPVQTGLRGAMGWGRGDYWFPDIQSVWGVAALFTLVLYPYVYIAARAAFLAQSLTLLEASRILGHGPWRTFLRVGLPLARPAIVAGAALALLETLADFGTVQYFGVTTFTTAIYNTWFGLGSRDGAAQLALALLVPALLLVWVERQSRGQARFYRLANLSKSAEATPLTRAAGWGATAVCALPILFGFAVPTLHLLRLALLGDGSFTDPRFLREAVNSLALATLAALAIVSLAIFMAYAGRLVRRRAFNATLEVASMGYAIPGTVIAVGILVPLALFDRHIDATARAAFGLSPGLLLSSTIAALLIAYVVRFLAVGIANVTPALAAIDPAMDWSARILGASPREVLARIHMPMLRGPALAAGLIVFVEVVKELPATLLIRPFNFDTLAVGVYQLAKDERLAQAAVGSILIVAAAVGPVILLSRAIARRDGATSSPPDP